MMALPYQLVSPGRRGIRGQYDPGQRRAVVEELVLEGGVVCRWVYLPGSLMVEVAGGHGSRGVVADREPCLGDRGERQIVGGTRAAHPGGHPAWFEGVGQYGWPAAGDGEG